MRRNARYAALGVMAALIMPAPALGEIAPASSGYVEKLGDGSFVTAVDGQTKGVRFALGGEYHISGKGFGGTVNVWILGNRGGGSMMDIVSQTDTELVVRVTDIPADEKPWAANASGNDTDFITVKIAADRGARVFRANLVGAWYDCKAGEPNCG